MSTHAKHEPREEGGLRRELSVWGVIGLSLATFAPSLAATLTPQASAASIGRAVPLAFIVATLGVLLVGWTFVRLTQRFRHAGSVYGFVGATIGARAGLVSGWSLLGVYILFAVITSAASGLFISAFLSEAGIWSEPPTWVSYVFAALILWLVWALATRPVKAAARTVLVIEGITVALILFVSIVVGIKLLTGSGAHGHHLEAVAFSVPSGTGLSAVFLGAVYGFLAFAGFEAAATLGEETREPRRAIPRAILGTVLFAGVFFIFVTWIEVSAFGADDAGLKAFTSSSSLIGDIARTYLSGWLGNAITAGVAVSAFGSALASVTGASRLTYAFARDGVFPATVATTDDRGNPKRATTAAVIAVAIILAVLAIILRLTPFEVFADGGAVSVLILLLVYALATIGAAKLLFTSGTKQVARWEVAVPAITLIVLFYTLYRNVIPYPSGAAAWFPIAAIVWVGIGTAWVFARPAAAERAGAALAADEGLNALSDNAEGAERL
ncbi:MAG: APC family permease [Gordonia sp. (in: high G+C Gram-positive bacteria)]